jgi:hypothetical protein
MPGDPDDWRITLLRNLVSLAAYLAVLGAFATAPLLIWLAGVVFLTDRDGS